MLSAVDYCPPDWAGPPGGAPPLPEGGMTSDEACGSAEASEEGADSPFSLGDSCLYTFSAALCEGPAPTVYKIQGP